MTRQEFDTKHQAGTLTVGDILDNPDYATPEQVAMIVDPKILRAFRDTGQTSTEALRCVARMLDDLTTKGYNFDEDLAAANWDDLDDGNARNTDCVAFARGTCPFGVHSKTDCPRYRQYYPERVPTASTR